MQKECIILNGPGVQILYQRYAPELFAYVYRQTNSREDAEDVLLEVFLLALEDRRFSSLNEPKQRAWLWTTVRRKVVDHYRSFSRHPKVPIAQVAETMFESEEQAPEQVALRREEYARLHETMKTLSTAQQEVLQLRFGHELSCAEIAHVMEKSESAVRMLLSRTLKLLRGIYAKR